jgi:hypothetical protein
MADRTDRRVSEGAPGPARLYALGAGGFLALLGVLGFFFDAGFDTGRDLTADDVAGIIVVNGWRNVLYLLSGLLALGFAARHPRPTAAALGMLYLVLGAWGLAETDHDIGSILEVLPLTDEDNALHLVLGGLGVIAALADGPLPKSPRSRRRAKRPRRRSGAKRPAASRSRA